MMEPLFTKVLQVAMVVKSVDDTVRTYYDVYGIGPWSIFEFNPENVEEMMIEGERIDYKMRIALTNIGDTRIELIEPLDDKTIYASFLKDHGEGLHHIAYDVNDYDKVKKFFNDKGINVMQEGKWSGIHQFTYFDSEKDLKHLVEIYKTRTDFFKYETDKYGNKTIVYPKPLCRYPPE